MKHPLYELQQKLDQNNMRDESTSYNPFDAGIQRAISSARASLSPTREQTENSFNRGLLRFAQQMQSQPRTKGFLNNLTTAGHALTPALNDYYDSEDLAMKQNNDLANQILSYRAAEEAKRAQEEQIRWQRAMHISDRNQQIGLARDQLEEQKRYHDMLNANRKENFNKLPLPTAENNKHNQSDNIDSILNYAEDLIKKQPADAYRGYTKRALNKIIDIPLTKEQAEINTLSDVLRGKLFNTWGYRNQAEFEHVPSLDVNAPPEVNLATLKTLRNLVGSIKNNESEIPLSNIDNGMKGNEYLTQIGPDIANTVTVFNYTRGRAYKIPVSDLEAVRADAQRNNEKIEVK